MIHDLAPVDTYVSQRAILSVVGVDLGISAEWQLTKFILQYKNNLELLKWVPILWLPCSFTATLISMNSLLPTEAIPLTDVHSSTWYYLTKIIPTKFYAYTFIALAISLLSISWTHNLQVGVIPIALYASWIIKIAFNMQGKFMEQFSTLNNLSYQLTSKPFSISGKALLTGRDRKVSSVITGQLNKLDYQLFLLTTTVGYGRNQRQIRSTVMEVALGKNVPNIYSVSLKPKAAHWWDMQLIPEPNTVYSLRLEGDFDKYYRIQVDPGEETAAMQIFEPNLMANLIDTPYRYDFELIDQTLFIYAPRFISTKAELASFYKFGQVIGSKIYNELSSMTVSDETARPTLKRLWPVGQFMINALTLMCLSLGFTGLVVTIVINATLPASPIIPIAAIIFSVLLLLGVLLLTLDRYFRR